MIRSSEYDQLWWLLIVTFRYHKWLHIAVGWQVSALYHNCGTTRCQGRSTVALPLTMITLALYGPCDDWHWLHGKVPQLSTVLGFWLQIVFGYQTWHFTRRSDSVASRRLRFGFFLIIWGLFVGWKLSVTFQFFTSSFLTAFQHTLACCTNKT